MRFYDSLPGPTILLNFTNYGHADILEDWVNKPFFLIIILTRLIPSISNKKVREYFASKVCHQCISDCEYTLYKKNSVKAISYFLLAVEQKNATYLKALENPKSSGFFDPSINITSIQKYNGFDILEKGPFCVHS